MSDVFNPKLAGVLSPDVREVSFWQGGEVEWPSVSTGMVVSEQELKEASFSGLGGILFEVDYAALEVETSTASYYLEARRGAEGYPALLGQTAVNGYRFLIDDGVGFAVEREDKSTGKLLSMRGNFIYDRFAVKERGVIFQPAGDGVGFSRSIPTGRVKSLRQVPIREKPLLPIRRGKRKLLRGL